MTKIMSALGLVLASVLAFLPTQPASAAPRSTYVVTSVLTINGRIVSTHTREVGGPAGASLYCNLPYTFEDADGSYTIQHVCGGSTATWSYRINTGLCLSARSPVDETGMSWTLGGKTQPMQAPHPGKPCSTYVFHGTYNPVRDGAHVAYADVFRWKLAGNVQAILQIYGSFVTTGTRGGCGVISNAVPGQSTIMC